MDSADLARREAELERKAARDSYRAHGGSRRRPLKSFTTDDERRERRLEHAAELKSAVDSLEDLEAFRDWIGALILNPDLSPLNCAIVSARLGPQLAATPAKWKQRGGYSVAKGETAACFVTAPGFKRRPVFTAEQVGATDLVELTAGARLPAELETLHGALCGALSGCDKRTKVVSTYGAELRENGALENGAGGLIARDEAPAISDEIPF